MTPHHGGEQSWIFIDPRRIGACHLPFCGRWFTAPLFAAVHRQAELQRIQEERKKLTLELQAPLSVDVGLCGIILVYRGAVFTEFSRLLAPPAWKKTINIASVGARTWHLSPEALRDIEVSKALSWK